MPTPPLPQHCPGQRELDDLELLVTGALRPLGGFNQPGSPVTLSLPAAVAQTATTVGGVELVDPEGLPLARVAWPSGEVTALTTAQYGPFRHLYLTPSSVRRRHSGRTFVPLTDAVSMDQLGELVRLGPVVLVALVGAGTPSLSPVGLIRATLEAADLLTDAAVLAVPLAAHDDPEADTALRAQVLATYAGGSRVHDLRAPAARTAVDLPASVAAVVAHDRPPAAEQGLVLFFTGLSGSGKSTIARALTDLLLEQGVRTVTSLDGDVVRRNLSAGLTFSKADRETNIRRIGWVAAEISRHGGVAVVSPIAPFDETRQQVRQLVTDAGGAFFLVHVATPLEECERRDRKGLYAKARAGEIPEFTGISSPYEEPLDADVRVDTTGRSIEDALTDVLIALQESGYLDLLPPEGSGDEGASSEGAPGFETVASAPSSTSGVAGAPSSTSGVTGGLKVLYVCTANICRSPTMELLSRHLSPDSDLVFSSAGTQGFEDQPLDGDMARVIASRGIAVSGFRSRALTHEMVEQADLVITAESAHRRFVLDEQPSAVSKVFTLGQLAEAVRQAPTGLSREQTLERLAAIRPGVDPRLDVADPYHRGLEASTACAAQIERLLRVVLTALTPSGRLPA